MFIVADIGELLLKDELLKDELECNNAKFIHSFLGFFYYFGRVNV